MHSERRHDDDSGSGTYEVHLRGTLPASFKARFPGAEVAATPAQTVLTREVEQCSDLDTLLDQLLSLGLVLTEVHESPELSPSSPTVSGTLRELRLL